MPEDDGTESTQISVPPAPSTAEAPTELSVVEARLLRDLDIANDWHPGL
jgi:hypothetical protein